MSDLPGPAERRPDRLARLAHVNVLVAAGRFREGMDRVCQAEGITHAQYHALWVLCLSPHAGDGVAMRDLADGLLTRSADTTRLVDRMVTSGLAERLASPQDRRVVLVRATDHGRKVFARLGPALRAYHRQQWAALTLEELEQLHRLLARALWGDAAGAARMGAEEDP